MPTRAEIRDLDRVRFREFVSQTYNTKLPVNKRDLTRFLENLELAHAGRLNLAGLLLFAENPQRFKPTFITKAVCFPGTSIAAREYIDSEDFEGTLQQQFEGAVAFVMRNLRKEQRGRNVNTTGIPEIPKFVFEELIVNALIHRDYFINAPIKVLVFSDRIEIVSPGSLPNHLTVDSIKLGISVVRNPLIVSFIAKGQLPYRGLGSGIRRAFEGTANIDFVDDRTLCVFTAIIRRTIEAPVEAPVEIFETGHSIINALKSGDLGRSDLLKVIGHAQRSGSFKKEIGKLLHHKIIERTIPEKPNSRLQKYRLTARGKQFLISKKRQRS